jgi:hypothetical protein
VLLAVVRAPASGDDRIKAAADALGVTVAEVRMRVAGEMPRVILNDGRSERIAMLAGVLERLQFDVITCDPAVAPTDAERVVARRLEIDGAALRAWDSQDRQHDCPAAAVRLIQRGARVNAERRETITQERRLDLARAVLSGGLLLTKKVTRTSVATTETRDPFLILQRGDGEPDLILYERRLDYRFLGAALQSSSQANFERLVTSIRAFFPSAPFDDRVARPGFVTALPPTTADPVDLALFLVTLARTRAREG